MATQPTPLTTIIPQPQKSLPFHYQLLAGGVAGTTEILIMYPLDVVKTRFQINQAGATAGPPQGVLGTLWQIVKTEGPTRLYRGIIPPILMEAPKRAIKFTANSQYTEKFQTVLPKQAWYFPIATGVAAGCTEAFVVVPFELIKIRMQDPNSQYTSTWTCLRDVLRQNGPLGLFKGMESTLWRHGVWSGVYFGCIGWFRELASPFWAGVIGGTFATLFNTPFDVVKTRIQNNQYQGGCLRGLAVIAKQEGYRALWKGFVPKVMRLGPGGGIMLVMFDTVQQWIRENLM